MKIVTAAVVFVMMVFIGGRSWGQNLVGNGSFEEISSCPTMGGQVWKANGWHNYGSCQFITATPDYFNTCAPDQAPFDVPDNFFGFRYPSDGDAYCGMWNYSVTYQFREIIGSELLLPLTPGLSYHLSFKIAKATTVGYDLAVNHIGMKFSMIPHDSVVSQAPIDNIAQLYMDTVMTDTTNWVLLSTDWVADSAYQYVMIGNFFDDTHTDTVLPEPFSAYAYYYVDEISVIDQSGNGIFPVNAARTFSLSPNPVQNLLTLVLHSFSEGGINFLSPSSAATIAVYDVAGRKIVLPTFFSNNKAELTTTTLPNGIYLLQIISTITGVSEVGKFVKE